MLFTFPVVKRQWHLNRHRRHNGSYRRTQRTGNGETHAFRVESGLCGLIACCKRVNPFSCGHLNAPSADASVLLLVITFHGFLMGQPLLSFRPRAQPWKVTGEKTCACSLKNASKTTPQSRFSHTAASSKKPGNGCVNTIGMQQLPTTTTS